MVVGFVRSGDSVLMATDAPPSGDQPFKGFSLSISKATEDEARKTFDALAQGGKVEMPLSKTFWSPCFGRLTDQFGVG